VEAELNRLGDELLRELAAYVGIGEALDDYFGVSGLFVSARLGMHDR
jgi:hypothetical protein